MPKEKPITFDNLNGMASGYFSGDWNVKKFKLPDEKNSYL